MIHSHRFLLAACFACLLPFSVYAEAPVVDEGENFALIDNQQAAFEQPVGKEQNNTKYNDEERPLVTDNSESTSNNAMLLGKLQGIQQELQELRGQLEVQAHDLKLLQQQQLAFYKDLDTRVRNEPVRKIAKEEPTKNILLDPKTTTEEKDVLPHNLQASSNKSHPEPVITPVVNTAGHNNPVEEQISYLAAYELVKNKRFDDALPAMQSFVERYPQGGYTANAQYWLGELYLVKKDYPKAIEHFEVVLNKFPSSSKSAASMLKIGYALAATGKKPDAIQQLRQVVKNYPDTNTAQLAKTKLEALGG